MRSNYWSCSKFADWLRGRKKLEAATSQDWSIWQKEAKNKYPFRYWLAEEGLDIIQNIINYPRDKIEDLLYYLNNRFVTKTHCLTAHKKDIKPGDWQDVGYRFLPCLFNELVNFVEVEQAWHNCVWDEEARKKFKPPWYRTGFLRTRVWRCPEAGIEHLKWASSLTMDESWGIDPTEEDYGKPTNQAIAAKEILELYNWFKNVYPNRPDVHDASGWTEYCLMKRNKGLDFFDLEDKTPEEKEMAAKALAKVNEIENAYNKEDEEMLIRLIRVRQALWT